jgi:hypothetical protein
VAHRHGPVIGTATVGGEPVVLAAGGQSARGRLGASHVRLNDNAAQTAAQFAT